MIPHIMKKTGTISLMIDGVMKPIDTAHKNYEEIKTALKAQEWDKIPELVNIVEQIEKALNNSSTESVTIKNGEVLYNGVVIHNSLTDRIVAMVSEGFDVSHMVKFLENLMLNPSFRAVKELYGFLEAGSIPITEKGTFLSYKKITKDWKDIYTGKLDNSIGTTVTMPRNEVDEDSERTCSAGLHVCSYDYLPSFGSCNGNRVVICEINPKDVVSIPTDYNNTKMRCCAYTVIGEVEDYNHENVLASKAVISTDEVNGKLDGTVDNEYLAQKAKDIGKYIESLITENKMGDNFESILGDMNDTYSYQEDIITIDNHLKNNEIKRACKKISKLLLEYKVDMDLFLSHIDDDINIDDPQKSNPIPDNIKAVGKSITQLLNNGNLCATDLNNILRVSVTNNLYDYQTIVGLASDGKYKKVGKEVSRAIFKNIINMTTLNQKVQEYLNFNNPKVCERCGSTLSSTSDECPSCGYFNS